MTYLGRITPNLLRRCIITGVPETAIVGSKTWDQMLQNVTAHETSPPLSAREIETTQRIIQLEKNISEMKEMMSTIVKSNQKICKEVHKTHIEMHTLFSKILTKQ